MTEYEAASLTTSYIGLAIAAGNMLAAIVAAAGIWVFGAAMHRSNKRRAEAEKNRHEESMTALKELIRRTSPSRPGRVAPPPCPWVNPPPDLPPSRGEERRWLSPPPCSAIESVPERPLKRDRPGSGLYPGLAPRQGGGWEGRDARTCAPSFAQVEGRQSARSGGAPPAMPVRVLCFRSVLTPMPLPVMQPPCSPA